MVKKIKVKRKRKKISRRNKNLIIGIVVLILIITVTIPILIKLNVITIPLTETGPTGTETTIKEAINEARNSISIDMQEPLITYREIGTGVFISTVSQDLIASGVETGNSIVIKYTRTDVSGFNQILSEKASFILEERDAVILKDIEWTLKYDSWIASGTGDVPYGQVQSANIVTDIIVFRDGNEIHEVPTTWIETVNLNILYNG